MAELPLLHFFELLILLACSAFFSSSETALFSLNPIQVRRVRARHPHAANAIDTILHKPTQLLSTILVGNTLVNVAASGLGYVIAKRLIPTYAELVSVVMMTFLLLILGEVAPKRLAMVHAERISVIYAPILRALIVILTPLRLLLDQVSSLFKRELETSTQTLSEDEFLSVVEAGEEVGILDEEEREMVDGIVGMEETQASDIMTPRVDLVGIDLDDPPEEQERIARSVTYRYLPLYRESLDHIEGVLDVLTFLLADERNLASATSVPFFVPEAAPLDNLLDQFRTENRRVAIVSDEFGGTAGLVTRGDLLEEIVEDVGNEYGEAKLSIQQTGENAWLIDGATSLEDVNYELDLELDSEAGDRISGWAMELLERIPRTGDIVEAQGCRVHVQRVRRQRVTLVSLSKTEPSHDDRKGKEETA
jgi:putative hemolysin